MDRLLNLVKAFKSNGSISFNETESCTELPGRLLDWFHVLRTSHVKEEMFAKGLPLPKLGEVIPQMKPKEAKMPFPSGMKLRHYFQLISSCNTLAVSCFLHHFKLYMYFLEKVKLTCYLHMWKDHSCHGYIINHTFHSKKKYKSKIWFGISLVFK